MQFQAQIDQITAIVDSPVDSPNDIVATSAGSRIGKNAVAHDTDAGRNPSLSGQWRSTSRNDPSYVRAVPRIHSSGPTVTGVSFFAYKDAATVNHDIGMSSVHTGVDDPDFHAPS